LRGPGGRPTFLTPQADVDDEIQDEKGNNEMPAISRQELRSILYGDPAPAAPR
jgi:hypothetical protein